MPPLCCGQSPGQAAPQLPQGSSFLWTALSAFDVPHCERPELSTLRKIDFRPMLHVERGSRIIFRTMPDIRADTNASSAAP